MSSSPVQPDPKEAVEAQLCAYLDGELSAAERAAIEQHLAVHPQHRQLLADLAMHREWLVALPRESAPADVGEAFRQQAERSLLMGEGEPDPVGRTTGRWRQLGLLAALLLMTAGLGVVVALMLTGPAHPAVRFAVDAPTTTLPSPPAVGGRSAAGTAEAVPPPVRALAAAAAPRPTTAADALAAAVPPITAPVPPTEADAVAPATMARAPQTPRTVHLLVTTTDPSQVDRFLTRSGLALDDMPDAAAKAARSAGGFGGGGGQQAQAAANGFAAAATQEQLAEKGLRMARAAAPGDAEAGVARRYVIHGLTAPQVRQLTADLTAAAAPGHVTAAPLKDRAATAPAGVPPISRGELVTVRIPQLTGAGLDQTNVVRVADDGTIALPMVDAVPAAGATPDEVARRVADRYRQANLIPNPTVTVSPARTTDGPATQPTTIDSVIVDVQPTPATPPR